VYGLGPTFSEIPHLQLHCPLQLSDTANDYYIHTNISLLFVSKTVFNECLHEKPVDHLTAGRPTVPLLGDPGRSEPWTGWPESLQATDYRSRDDWWDSTRHVLLQLGVLLNSAPPVRTTDRGQGSGCPPRHTTPQLTLSALYSSSSTIIQSTL